MAVVDAKYEFIYVDVGTNGRISDGGVWEGCSLKESLERQDIGLPPPCQLPRSEAIAPFVFVADDAFPLKPYLMKPFPFRHQTNEQRIFSYRLSRARRTVENAFGILANRFRVLLKPINLEPAKVDKVVLACVVLHNLLRRDTPDNYTPVGSMDREDLQANKIVLGAWHSEGGLLPLQRNPRRVSDEAKAVREKFCAYFNHGGAVAWQREMAGLE